ncbi:GntR family transcriptional regulator [Rathayibacter sp. VKM Ac-2929]|uniref:FadR/GntR family transcriptional regulator n=1 Tax=Rathayibacter sp. VKM Ac-2929 TaxID=2929480 RepID=UPI001FB259B3|nr:FCD domain-containing protein [Rathayibacter sp. VKM Ac-2929]MCJ1672435.1 GntR family transcriptional regulator [Rathayibacter sp. VKM Ac-2929]
MSAGTGTGGTDDDAEGRPAAPAASAREAILRRLLRSNAFEETVQRLMQTVSLGLVGPGERLPSERELAAQLGVGRDTLREAIASLADAGYLVVRRGRYGGAFVAEELPAVPVGRRGFDRAEIDDVVALREILEVGAARLAAGADLTAADREQLFRALADVEDASPEDYRRLDSRLHLTIAELAGVPSLLPLVAESRTRVNALLDDIPLLPRNIAHADEQHRALVTAILTGRAVEAARLMTEHVHASAALLRAFLT